MKLGYVLFLAGVISLAGCGGQTVQTGSGPTDMAFGDGLEVSVQASQQTLRVGDELRLTVTVRNTTRRAIPVDSRSGAPVYVRVWRNAGLFWDEIKRYPENATMIMTPWSLPGREQRQFVMTLPVEPDWPTGETLKISAEMNGRPELQPSVKVTVLAPYQP